MAMQCVTGAMCKCTFGTTPSPLTAIPKGSLVTAENCVAATILDHIPSANVAPFGMCSSLANPTVASATSAAAGVLTPMPCVPVTPAPWTPGSPTILINNAVALNDTSTLMCSWAGVISITYAGQTSVTIP